jgi:hypothetical protein
MGVRVIGHVTRDLVVAAVGIAGPFLLVTAYGRHVEVDPALDFEKVGSWGRKAESAALHAGYYHTEWFMHGPELQRG